MAAGTVKRLATVLKPPSAATSLRQKTTSAEYVAIRARDPTFEKLMERYKNLLKVISIQDLILAGPQPHSISIDFLHRISQKLHLNRGAAAFLRKYPHIFHIFNHPTELQPHCSLQAAAMEIFEEESLATRESIPLVVQRLVRILSMSPFRAVPLRAVFKVWKELGLPDDFEDSVIANNPSLFALAAGKEPNTHILKLVCDVESCDLISVIENWRVLHCCKEDCDVDRTTMQYSFRQSFPPGMKLSKTFRARVKEWQMLPYTAPYERMQVEDKRRTKHGMKRMEKRAVGIVHEFLSLTVEKMVEVEKISQFRKWFGIDLNIRDLFLDHPGIFYLSTKGKKHTVFLREAYERGCLIEPNPVYQARRKLLHLVSMGHRGWSRSSANPKNAGKVEEGGLGQEEGSDDDDHSEEVESSEEN